MKLKYLQPILLVIFWPLLSTCWAQKLPAAFEMEIPNVRSYDSSIPTPGEVLGHTIGTRHTVPHQLVDYFKAVDEASERIVVNTHAYSYENRPLIHAIVTSPANHAKLEQIRQQNLLLSDDPRSVNNASLEDMPVVVYQGYSIHGNEASGSEAAVLYLYHLAAGMGNEIDDLLENAVIIVDPSFNPDGRDRFTDWVNRNRGGVHVADPYDREHNEPWPGGRTNHYWFDLNRDWLPAQHPESQGRLELFHDWRPQLLTDHHEMGGSSTFFFMPGIPSRNNPLTPDRNFELTDAIAGYHARWLDGIGSLYYSKESFDDFYYGKGSTYPDANGTVGILFEQASSRALESQVNHGNLHYAVTVQNHFTTSLSTIDAAYNLRMELLAMHRDFYATAGDVARQNTVKAYVVSLERDRTRSQKLAEMLRRHRIRIYDLARDVRGEGMMYRAGQAFVVPVNQPQARLIKSMFERVTSFTDSLFYDVSTWTMPLAFDLDYSEIRTNPSSMLGSEIREVDLDGGRLIGAHPDYGYLIKWDRYFAPRALYRLQDAGFFPRLLHRPVEVVVEDATYQFAPGTIFVPSRHRDPSLRHQDFTLPGLIDDIVALDHVEVYALQSGYAASGPDLGTRTASILEKPVIGLLTGSGTSSYNAGEVWHLLAERFQIPISLLDVQMIDRANLNRYTTLVMAGGGYSGLDVEKMTDWIRAGGKLITIATATDWAIRSNLLSLEEKTLDTDSLLADFSYAELNKARGALVIGGAIFEARLDITHPLAYSFRETVPLFRRSSTFYELPSTPGQNVAMYSRSPLLSGYISEERLKQVSGSAALVAKNMGRGSVVAFMDNPNFRAFWYGSNRLFLNALFFGDAF